MKAPDVMIACGIFKDELPAVLPAGSCEILWLDTALHAEPARLRAELGSAGKKALKRTAGSSAKVRLLVGSACHPDMQTLAGECGACAAPFKNCIEALAGGPAAELADGRTMMITPGWVRAWPGRASALGWDETEMRIQHGRYDRIVLLDPGIRPVSDEEVLNLFELLRVPIEVQPLDLGPFQKLVKRMLG